jgi:CheY-like chemotaxis protein
VDLARLRWPELKRSFFGDIRAMIADGRCAGAYDEGTMGSAIGTVLVVDDDVEIRETMMNVLACEGYEVIGAANGVQALERLRSALPSVMLLDLMMPVMSGWEVIEELERTGEIEALPIVVVSAMGAPGAQECLAKPVALEDLLQAVGRCCGGRSSAVQISMRV